jgi:hypothetical protein
MQQTPERLSKVLANFHAEKFPYSTPRTGFLARTMAQTTQPLISGLKI